MTQPAKHTPGPIGISIPCSVCGTRGWILVRNDTHGLRIERCDECAIMTDSQAWDIAESFLVDLLMRFDEGTNLEKATAAPAMYEALKVAQQYLEQCQGKDDEWQVVTDALAQAEGKQ